MIKQSSYLFTILIAVIATGMYLAGCEDAGIESSLDSEVASSEVLGSPGKSHAGMAIQGTGDISRELASLRRETAPFHNINKAIQANYDTPITPCWYHSDLGAMGYHYGNLSLFDGSVDLLKPEALMYEPGPGGHYRLVGMEYIVPIDAWEGEDLPSLLGQEYHPNENLGLYTLHLWLWRDNPNGLFAAWNPKVTCEYAEESEDRAGL